MSNFQKIFVIMLTIILSDATIPFGQASAVNNESIKSVIDAMAEANKKMISLSREDNDLVTANEKLVKKNTLWQEQLDTRLQPLVDVHIAKSKAHVANEKYRQSNRILCTKLYSTKETCLCAQALE